MLIGFGGAGVLAAIDHPAGTAARAELTWDADRLVTPEMDRAEHDLEALSEQVDRLGVEGRRVLVALAGRDPASISAGVAAGAELSAGVSREAAAIRERLAAIGGADASAKLQISQAQLARHAVAVQALEATRGLDTAWARLTSGADNARRLLVYLVGHDSTMAAAAAQGRQPAYTDALRTIAVAEAMLDESTALRNQLANTTDVGILDQWLHRNRTYDAALKALYAAFVASNGQVTQAVADAFNREQSARAQLPPDTRGLELIMVGIAQGGLNEAVIAIEYAGDQLAHALEVMPESAAP